MHFFFLFHFLKTLKSQFPFSKKTKVTIIFVINFNKTFDFKDYLVKDPQEEDCITKNAFFTNILKHIFSLFYSLWHEKLYII